MTDTSNHDSGPWTVSAIGTVSTSRTEAIDDEWGDVVATITLREPLGERSLLGITEFSHVEVIYLFHGVDPAGVQVGSRIPRSNPAWPEVGPRGQVRQPQWSHELMANYY